MKRKKSIQRTNWVLLGKYLTSEATPAEREALEKWAYTSKINLHKLKESENLFRHTDIHYQLKNFDTEAAWQKTSQRVNLPKTEFKPIVTIQKRLISAAYKYAAILIAIILLGAIGYFISTRSIIVHPWQEIAATSHEVVNDFLLPDGSVVTLNNNTILQFPEEFESNQRTVILTGEAFFDIQSDPDRPFIIQAGDAEIKVLGTAFNISAYPGEETVEVVVENGTVRVTCPRQNNHEVVSGILLQAGEKAVLLNAEKKLEKSINSNPNYLAWKTRQLIFENTPLSEVIQQLSNTFHSNIQTSEEELGQLLLTARFDDKPVEFILEVVQLTFDLRLTEKEGVYILSRKETLKK